MGKTSFRIIFLPTEEGSFESSLFINTSSHGVFSYHVSNFILPCNLAVESRMTVLRTLGEILQESLPFMFYSDPKSITSMLLLGGPHRSGSSPSLQPDSPGSLKCVRMKQKRCTIQFSRIKLSRAPPSQTGERCTPRAPPIFLPASSRRRAYGQETLLSVAIIPGLPPIHITTEIKILGRAREVSFSW